MFHDILGGYLSADPGILYGPNLKLLFQLITGSHIVHVLLFSMGDRAFYLKDQLSDLYRKYFGKIFLLRKLN